MDLDELTRELAGEVGVAGAQIAVLHQGTLRQGVAGIANLDTGVEVTNDTLFQIGSTAKAFTAALVMELVHEGRIGLDVPVVEQLPGFTLSNPNATRTVTPRPL